MSEPKFVESIPAKPDLAKFREDLSELTLEYATAAYIVFGRASNPEFIAEQKQQAAELYSKLIEKCAETLKATKGSQETMDIIHEVVLMYVYKGSGTMAFGGTAAAEFYQKLAMKIAEK